MAQGKQQEIKTSSSKATAGLTIGGCVAIFAIIVIAIVFLARNFTDKAEVLLFEVVDASLEQNVKQIVSDIDVFKETEIDALDHEIDAFGKDLQQSHTDALDLVSGQAGDVWRSAGLVFAVWDDVGKPIYSDIKTKADGPRILVDKMGGKLATYEIFTQGDYQVLCAALMETVDERVKQFASTKIHSMEYEDQSYLWVNEVDNFEGGEDYATRLIHPALPETEGMQLSTNMQDAVGGYPYLEELEGINENGEVWYSYYFVHPESGEHALKETYAYLYEPYNWVICMGTYVEDLDGYLEDIRTTAFWASAAAITLVALVLLGVSWGILHQAKRYAARTANYEAEHRLTKTKDAIFSNLSHDMRTPLNAIIGFSTLASKEETSPAVKDYLEKINISGSVLLNLLNDSLAINRISEGEQTLINRPFNASELAQECMVVARASALEKGVELISEVPQADDIFLGDRNAIEKIFFNVVSNGIKYTAQGGTVTASIGLASLPQREAEEYDGYPEYAEAITGRAQMIITITDTGIGMSNEFMEHIFEPFTQENVSPSVKQGVGLGLSIVKQLIDLMSGTVSVESEKGVGSTFRIRIPLWRLNADALNREETPKAADAEGQRALSSDVLAGAQVLVCEDNFFNRELVRDVLGDFGAEPTFAENGQEGCEAFEQSEPGHFDLILMDLRMPVMNGHTAARTIRAMNRQDAKDIPIIALSADAFEEDIIKSREAGMNRHIAKPFDPDELHDDMAELIEAYRDREK